MSKISKIKDIMRSQTITCMPEDTVLSVAEKLKKFRIGCIIVTDKNDFPVGIITESDIIRSIASDINDFKSVKAQKIMTSPVITLHPDTDLDSTALLMTSNRIRRIPVLLDKKLIGLASYRDLTDDMRKSYYMLDEIVEEKANKDPLTGLFNKGYITEQLEFHFELSKRIENKMSVTILDIDYFKNVNDTYGHLCGDKVLSIISSIINSEARTIDIVSRYGGEEFLIIGLVTNEESSLVLPERIRKRIEETPFTYDDKVFNLTISAGVSIWNNKMKSYKDLVIKADEALYKAKDSGRNKVILSKK